jgi:hypothetical protein
MADAGKETATTPATSIELCVVLLLIGILPATVTGSKKAGNAQQLKSAHRVKGATYLPAPSPRPYRRLEARHPRNIPIPRRSRMFCFQRRRRSVAQDSRGA